MLSSRVCVCLCVSLCTCLYRENSKTTVVLFDRTIRSIRCWGLFLGGNRMISLSFSLSLLPRCSCFLLIDALPCVPVYFSVGVSRTHLLSLSLSLSLFPLILSSVFFSGACTIDSDKKPKEKTYCFFFFLHLYSCFHSLFSLYTTDAHTYAQIEHQSLSIHGQNRTFEMAIEKTDSRNAPGQAEKSMLSSKKEEGSFRSADWNNRKRIWMLNNRLLHHVEKDWSFRRLPISKLTRNFSWIESVKQEIFPDQYYKKK